MAEMTRTNLGGGVSFPSGQAIQGRCVRVPADDSGAPETLEMSPYASRNPVTVTALQVKALRATPISIISAPGAGKVVQFLGAMIMLDYGTVAFAEDGGGSNLAFRLTNGSGAKVSDDIEMTGFITLTADAFIQVVPVKDVLLLANTAIVLHNIGAGEIVTGDSVLKVYPLFAVHG